ncbi:annexin A5-like isoform X2 [Gordionus sp. m RMFG-2023]|uniref:annexin A5-like isoform X2 n=1 Tax=Gordionus sp. m RMFG-2023 TaxID=3053472 RepID=UPI0031FDFBCB
MMKKFPTITDSKNFDPRADAEKLMKAMKRMGTNEKEILNIVARRSNNERQMISHTYQELYKKDLIKDLKGELSKKLEKIILALMIPVLEYDCLTLRNSIKGIGTNECLLIQIICSKSFQQLTSIQECYKKCYSTELINDLKHDTSGNFEKILISLLTIDRKQAHEEDRQKVIVDAKALAKESSEKLLFFNKAIFIEILTSRDLNHLKNVFAEYERITKLNIEDVIRKEMHGDSEHALTALVECIRYPSSFFAKRINHTLEGMGTQEDELIYIIVSRSERDLGRIKQEYERIYDKSLEQCIKSDTSGDFEDALLLIIKGNC